LNTVPKARFAGLPLRATSVGSAIIGQEFSRGLGGSRGGDFSYGGSHSPRTCFQSEPEARLRSNRRHQTVRQRHTAQWSHEVHAPGRQAHGDQS
jgi:hypothetical protein